MKRLGNTENKLFLFTKEKYVPLLTMIVLITLWQLITYFLKVPEYILPSPFDIVRSLINSWEVLWQHSLTTIYEAGVGFIVSIVFALVIAILMNQWKLLRISLYPILVISQTVPIIALAPLIMIWMGFGSLPKIVVVVVVCFFPISVNVIEGLTTVDKDLINIMNVMGANKLQIFLKVKLPSTLPSFFAGLKIAATYSIMGAIIGEWLGARSGLGIFMTRTMSSFKTSDLFASILIVVILSVGLFKIIELIGKRVMPWNRGIE
jgi:ABC-type nitrate/sulfonate/bicarbonate transport system permease component